VPQDSSVEAMADGECNASLGQEEIVGQDQSKQWRELLKLAIFF